MLRSLVRLVDRERLTLDRELVLPRVVALERVTVAWRETARVPVSRPAMRTLELLRLTVVPLLRLTERVLMVPRVTTRLLARWRLVC